MFDMKVMNPRVPVYRMVADGIVALPQLAEGRFMPAVVVDFKGDPNVEQLIDLHEGNRPGDVVTQWARVVSLGSPKHLVLHLHFKQPMDVRFGLRFSIEEDMSTIDGIVCSKGFHLHSGKEGDKVSHFANTPRGIVVEVATTGFSVYWERLLVKTVRSQARVKGEPKRLLDERVRQHIAGMRQFWVKSKV
jgi:hypothetical protein